MIGEEIKIRRFIAIATATAIAIAIAIDMTKEERR